MLSLRLNIQFWKIQYYHNFAQFICLLEKNAKIMNSSVGIYFSELTYCKDNPNTCQNGAKCISLTKDDGNYRCFCREGSYGRNCEYTDVYFTTTLRPPLTTTRKMTYITSNLTLIHLDPKPIITINEQLPLEITSTTINASISNTTTSTTSISPTTTITTEKYINLNDTNLDSNNLSENETSWFLLPKT